MNRHCFDIAGETNIGAGRMKNEDNYCILVPPGFSSGLAVVADGIGGHRDGELASMFCCHGMMKEFLRRGRNMRTAEAAGGFLAATLRDINARLFRRNEFERRERPMGCTAMCAVFTERELVWCGAGDSRLYEFSPGSGMLRQLSADDICPGTSALCRAVGIRRRLDPVPEARPLCPGTMYLICSDGLYHFVDDAEIVAALTESTTARMAVGKLMRRALLRGAGDNITVIVAWLREACPNAGGEPKE